MILVDATIVTVAIPTISTKLHADTDAVIWVMRAAANVPTPSDQPCIANPVG